MKRPHSPQEILAVVDDKDHIIGRASRTKVHREGLFHREAYCYLINSKKQVLLQKRADSALWDHSCAGHFPLRQDYLEAIQREFKEELGIELSKSDFKEITKEKLERIHQINREVYKNFRFVKIFLVKKDIPISAFKIDRGEVMKVRYFSLLEIKKLIKSRKITFSADYLLEKYIFSLL
jgi:isopentenyldiphosphate isomerase